MTLAAFFIFIPLTIYLTSLIPGRSYYIAALLIVAELMLPIFVTFEKRRVPAHELTLLAVLCALAVIGRVAIPIPNFKATFAIIMLSGIALGAHYGFICGAMAAFVSNFFFGQGAYLPWQMLAYGAGGMLAGFCFMSKRLSRRPWILAVFGFLSVVLFVGPLLDCAHLFLLAPDLSVLSITAALVSGFTTNVSQGIATALVMFFFGVPLLEKIHRVLIKYGETGAAYGD